MKIAKVIGKISATRKTGKLTSQRLLVVDYLDHDLRSTGKTTACVDSVNAGEGEIVLLCGSSSARMTDQTRDVATDQTIIGIVDAVSAGKTNQYAKNK